MSEPIPPVTSTAEYYRPVPVWAPPARRQRYWLHGFLLLLTCFTTLVMGARMQYNFTNNQPALSLNDESVPYFPAQWIFTHRARILGGVPFAATVMLFFLAHEMGHYLCCLRYGIYCTLPFFIPVPTPIGTMGAVILIRSPIRSRTALFDIGIAGPIAGFVVALATLVVSLGWSKPIPIHNGASEYDLAYPIVFRLVHGCLAVMNPASPIARLPLGRVLLHPAAIAAWVGMFATALNLLPGGQLDGGHILYAISPSVHRLISRLTILILLPMAYFFWLGWIMWAVLLQWSSLRHPPVAEWPQVAGWRKWLAGFALFMLVVTLTAAPLGRHSLPEAARDFVQIARDLLLYLRYWLQHLRGR